MPVRGSTSAGGPPVKESSHLPVHIGSACSADGFGNLLHCLRINVIAFLESFACHLQH